MSIVYRYWYCYRVSQNTSYTNTKQISSILILKMQKNKFFCETLWQYIHVWWEWFKQLTRPCETPPLWPVLCLWVLLRWTFVVFNKCDKTCKIFLGKHDHVLRVKCLMAIWCVEPIIILPRRGMGEQNNCRGVINFQLFSRQGEDCEQLFWL